MSAASSPQDTPVAKDRARGYADPAYAAALSHLGTPVELARAGGWLLRRAIPGAAAEDAPTDAPTDAAAPYPLLACADWSALAQDLAQLRDLVSVTAVIDPFAGAAAQDLSAAFPDHLIDFKRHYLVDLTSDFRAARSSHHRRSVKRGCREVEVTRAEAPQQHADEWAQLYAAMALQVGLTGGASDFPPESLAAQLAVPGMRYYRARVDGKTVAGSVWLRQGDRIYYHLGASRPEGKAAKASFALFDQALDDAAREGLALASLGGVAGLEEDADDGLAFFKRGWSTGSCVAQLGGRVLDRARYDQLGAGTDGFFPAYRCGGAR